MKIANFCHGSWSYSLKMTGILLYRSPTSFDQPGRRKAKISDVHFFGPFRKPPSGGTKLAQIL